MKYRLCKAKHTLWAKPVCGHSAHAQRLGPPRPCRQLSESGCCSITQLLYGSSMQGRRQRRPRWEQGVEKELVLAPIGMAEASPRRREVEAGSWDGRGHSWAVEEKMPTHREQGSPGYQEGGSRHALWASSSKSFLMSWRSTAARAPGSSLELAPTMPWVPALTDC